MGNGSRAKEISLGDDFGEVIVSVNLARIAVHADGTVEAKSHQPAAAAELQPGDRLADGTIFAGISPETNKPMYTTPADTGLSHSFNQAQKYAAALDANGHKDWRVPTKGELKVLFQNRAAIGGFDESGSYPAGWYWSSSRYTILDAWAQRFSDGYQNCNFKFLDSYLRCVR